MAHSSWLHTVIYIFPSLINTVLGCEDAIGKESTTPKALPEEFRHRVVELTLQDHATVPRLRGEPWDLGFV
jgi:hypothetical protein